MLGRLYGFLFLAALGYGLWYQHNYIETFRLQLEAEAELQRQGLEVYNLTNFSLTQYKEDMPRSILQAGEAVQLSHGELTLQKDIVLREFDEDHTERVVARTSVAKALIDRPKNSRSWMDGDLSVKTAEIPNDIVARFEEDTIRTREVHYDSSAAKLFTESRVEVKGPSGTMNATGAVYHIPTEELRLAGPVSGKLIRIPPSSEALRKKEK